MHILEANSLHEMPWSTKTPIEIPCKQELVKDILADYDTKVYKELTVELAKEGAL